MSQQGWLSRYGLILGALMAVVALVLIPVLLGRFGGTAPSDVARDAPKSDPGWEIRYDATLALARRGSERVKDEKRLEAFREMLDEQRQLRNFTLFPGERQRPDEPPRKTAVTDAAGAYNTIITALKVMAELHRKRPDLNLCVLDPAINEAMEKLAHSSNPAVSAEVERTRQELATQ
jgi:hypothetical protein